MKRRYVQSKWWGWEEEDENEERTYLISKMKYRKIYKILEIMGFYEKFDRC